MNPIRSLTIGTAAALAGALLTAEAAVAAPLTLRADLTQVPAATSASLTRGVVLIDTSAADGEGAGTGMVIDATGLVLTNYHVVEGSTSVKVTIADSGKTYPATVLGHDATKDVALLQLKGANGLATVKTDETVAEGESVTAVGNGGGTGELQETSGTVLATGQAITASDDGSAAGSENLTNLIESDAGIVPGYSGGPLLDADGEVVGINVAGSQSRRGAVDAYSIPIGEAFAVATTIRSGTSQGTTVVGRKAALGILVSSRPSRTGGVLVQDVLAGGAAEQAGITPGSTLLWGNAGELTDGAALSSLLESRVPGDTLAILWRDSDGQVRVSFPTLQASTVN